MAKPPKIAVAGFQHETNTFAPFKTEYDDFLVNGGWPGLTIGEDIHQKFDGLNIPISGFLDNGSDFDIHPICWCEAEPAGPVSEDAFERITELICTGIADAGSLDGIYLDLHGAMVADGYEDGEGELLQRIRNIVGPDLPVVLSLDLHANITQAMVDLCDAMTVYRTYPHIDMFETGVRAAHLLRRLIGGKSRFHKGFLKFPYLVPLSSQCTDIWPNNGLFSLLKTVSVDSIASIEMAAGFPAADIQECGPSLVVYGEDEKDVLETIKYFSATIDAAERNFVEPLLSAEEAVHRGMQTGKPGETAILADVEDNPGAGAMGDGTGLIRELIAQKATGAVVAHVWDPEAIEECYRQDAGSEITLSFGDRYRQTTTRFRATFRIEAFSDGRITCNGPVMQGNVIELGRMAVLHYTEAGADIRVVLTENRTQCLDRDMLRAVGIEPSEQSIIVLKSTNHFRADFDPIANVTLMVETGGFNPCRLETIRYERLRQGVRLGPMGPPNGI